MTNSELHIHGHSCLEIRTNNLSLVCDPWLSGSAYWRSWWNFPESKDFNSLLDIWCKQKNLYIYITHLHWDHFHGPSLRKIKKFCKGAKFIIPRTPEKRLKSDLVNVVGNKSIFEIKHAEKLQLDKNLSILSFQFGPFFADSILSINSSKFNILNMNDAKILDLSLSHLLSVIPKPDYVLRSHSSANSRCCLHDLNGNRYPIRNIDKQRDMYSKEFFDACYATGANVAIPFASNMACLHKETYEYNSVLNFSDYVIQDFKSLRSEYKEMDCKMILPTETLILETKEIIENHDLRYALKNQSRDSYLRVYQQTKSKILQEQYLKEQSEEVSYKLLSSYFLKIIKYTPLILKIYLSNKIFIEAFTPDQSKLFNINFLKCSINETSTFIKSPKNVKLVVNAYVLNDVCKKSHWNSLGVSKRLKIYSNLSNMRFTVFNFLCNTIESGGLIPATNILSVRFISIWFKRYREIIDLIIYASRIIFYKVFGKKFYFWKKVR